MSKKGKFYDDSTFDEKKKDVVETITEQSSAEVETTGPETKNGIITNALFVKLRQEPNFNSEVVMVLRKDDVVTIVGKHGDFYKVTTKSNKVGYISSPFVKEE